MRISLKSLFLFILFASSISSVMAQATKEVFSTAVDHINCETIRFIHREAGRAEVANDMDCLSFLNPFTRAFRVMKRVQQVRCAKT